MQLDHLRALLAIVDEGSFDAAADVLRISPSAVSQRIKALETAVGQVVVRRGAPCTVTEAGSVLLRMARQVQVLEAETRTALGGAGSRAVTPVAVNADSLATWFLPVLREAAGWEDTTLDLHVEDEDHSSLLLRRGDVVAAVTADPAAVNGCRVERLGHMRYVPVATPGLRQRYTAGSRTDWSAMPVLRFNGKDEMQQRLLRAHRIEEPPPTHTIPSSEAFLAAVKAGLGWGMLPELQLDDELDTGSLVLLDERGHHDVALYWQAWTLQSARLERLGATVHDVSGRRLRRTAAGRRAGAS